MDSVFFYLVAMMCIMLFTIVFIVVESVVGVLAFFSFFIPIIGYMVWSKNDK